MDALVFWRSFNFVNQNKNPTKSKNTIPNYRCAHLSECIRYHRQGYKNQLSINNAAISKNNQKLLAS